MGCLNVDDRWFADPRRDSLVERIGQIAADGTAMKMWRLAEVWFRKEAKVPRDLFFTCKHAQDFLDVGLAEEKPDGIYIKGSKEFFQYIVDGKESKSKGGKSRAESGGRDGKGRFIPATEESPADTQQNPAASSSDQLNPGSLSLAFSLSSEIQNKELKGSACAPPQAELVLQPPKARAGPTEAEKKAIAAVIRVYVPAWQARYATKARPDIGKVSCGIILRLVRDRPIEQVCELIQVYCQMRNQFFDTRKHDLATFEKNINAIALAHDRGDESALNWERIFGDGNGKASIRGADPPVGDDLQRPGLPAGTG